MLCRFGYKLCFYLFLCAKRAQPVFFWQPGLTVLHLRSLWNIIIFVFLRLTARAHVRPKLFKGSRSPSEGRNHVQTGYIWLEIVPGRLCSFINVYIEKCGTPDWPAFNSRDEICVFSASFTCTLVLRLYWFDDVCFSSHTLNQFD